MSWGHIDQDTGGIMKCRILHASRQERVRGCGLRLRLQLSMDALTLLDLLIRATRLLTQSHSILACRK